MLVALEALDSNFIAQARHHNLAVLGVFGGLHGQQVAIQDAGVPHGHAAHLEQVVRLALKQAVFNVIGLVHMLLRENWRAGCHPAYERQGKLGEAGQRELMAARFVDGAQCVALEANAARGATDQIDHAFAGQRLQMFFGGVGRFETQLGRDFGTCGRSARACNRALDEVQNLLLAGGEFHWEAGQVDHADSFGTGEYQDKTEN